MSSRGAEVEASASAPSGLSVRSLPTVLVAAGRLIVRHWPALVVLAFTGIAVRNAALWAAVQVSDHNSFLGQLLLVFTPLGYLLPIIAMLHICGRSLDTVREVAEQEGPIGGTEQRPRRLMDIAVSVLVPFLVVYVSLGMLEEDRQRFINEAAYDEFQQGFGGTADYSERLAIFPFTTLLIVVAIAWVVRWALGLAERRLQFFALSVLGALVETYYAGQGAYTSDSVKNISTNWIEDRQAVDRAMTSYQAAVERLGPLTDPIQTVLGWVGALLGSADLVIVMPIAWLTVGAVVLGHKLNPPKHEGYLQNATWLPGPVRRVGGSLFGDIAERWSAFTGGVRMLFVAGLLPMLLFCVVFLFVLRVPILFSHLVRLVQGPVDTNTWLAFSPWETGVGLALSMMLAAPLLAAALDLVLRSSLATRDDASVSSAPAG